MTFIALDYWDLALAAALLIINAGLSIMFRLGLEYRLLFAAARMVVQLSLVGLGLKVLFAVASPWWTTLAALVMVGFAGREAMARQDRSFTGYWAYGIGTSAMCMAALTVTLFAVTTQFETRPWYDARYALPLLGMILGNAMNGVSLALDRLVSEAHVCRVTIEARLALGSDAPTALEEVKRKAIRAGMIPTINAMSATGLVSLPGMMTGQLLSGTSPIEAVKYQIMIRFLVASATALGTVGVVALSYLRLFSKDHQFLFHSLQKKKP